MPRYPGVLKGWWWDFWFHQPHVEQRAPTFSYTPSAFMGLQTTSMYRGANVGVVKQKLE